MSDFRELAEELRKAGMFDLANLIPEVADALEEIGARLARLEYAAKTPPKK